MSDTTEFIKGLNMLDPIGLYIKIFNSTSLTVIKEFRVLLVKRELQNVGATIMVKNFAPSFLYYLLEGGDIEQFRLKKNSVLNIIDNKEVSLFVKKEKIKLDNESDLKKVLTFYNQLLNK